MKYPYISKLLTGEIFLHYKEDKALSIKAVRSNFGDSVDCIEARCKNITAEYLANTYGEVKSKEHAEFIVKLSGGDSSSIGNSWSQSLKCFVIDSDCKVSFGSRVYYQEKVGKREITIPLPPECEAEDEWPKVGSSVEWGHTGKGEVKSLSDGFAWVKLDNKDYTTVYISSLRKPKTPEQELREFLHLLWRENNEDFDDFADIAVLHLTKKGEGDE